MKRVILMCLVALFTVGAVSAQKPQKGGKQNVTTVFVTDIDCAGCENIGNFKQPHPIVGGENPYAPGFNSSMVWGPLTGIKGYVGIRLNIY